jgi:hypothetical protein
MASNTLEIAARIGGDGMPLGNVTTLPIRTEQVETDPEGVKAPTFDDDAAATMVWQDYQRAMAWLDENSWLLEWQYIDFLYQSPNYDRDARGTGNRAARISRFNVAKNSNTMSCQTRRAVFGDDKWFILEPRGKLAGMEDAEKYLNAWTELFLILSDRADLQYNMRLFIECMALQGTGIAIPGVEEKTVMRATRKPKKKPEEITLPAGNVQKVHTWESDDWELKKEEVTETWPFFEYRRLGTTLYSEKWRHPNKPELSGWPRIDIDFVNYEDLSQLRELDCYKDIPPDDKLKTYFLSRPSGDALPGTETAQNMSASSSALIHAAGENVQASANPFQKPLMKIAYWTEQTVIEILCYEGRRKVIRNEQHGLGDQAAGYTASWYNIENSGYGYGIGRLNAGDQRMSQGVLNEVLKMIAFPLNAPILYDNAGGNAPVQNIIAGLGMMLGVDTGPSHDINKAMKFMEMPQVPPEAWKIYQVAMEGGQDLVGANQTTMQGQLGGPGSSFGRTAAGANRLSSKADENITDPVDEIERVLTRWLQFLWRTIREVMPIKEIRDMLSEKYGAAILDEMEAETFIDARFNIKILCGQKLAAKAAIAQLIPFLLQIMQQPQMLQYLHEIGMTVNFMAIANLFIRMSELAAREDIFIPLTDDQKKFMAQMQPGIQKVQADAKIEAIKGTNRIAEVREKGKQDMQKTLVEKAMDHVEGAVPLELAEARLARNDDMATLQQGAVPQP